MNVAILGFGTIGTGVYEIIKDQKASFLKDTTVTKILDLPQNKDKLDIIVCDIKDIVEDASIDLVVETMGGIHPAYEFIMDALQHGKHVVTANKAVVAAHLEEFVKVAKENNVYFLFEASTGGGIPWLASIQKARRVDAIDHFYGIFNGTSNFILDYMFTHSKGFDEALRLAQELGYAEANPSADIDGYDVQNKVVISSALAFDASINMKDFPCFSMAKITFDDIQFLKEKDCMAKYIGEARSLNNAYEAFVMPNIFSMSSIEANVKTNFNMATLHGETIGDLKFYGQGAGKLPTANAIVQDILDIKANSIEVEVQVNKALPYTDTLLANQYLLRTNKAIQNEDIDHVEEFHNMYYIYTKAITTKAFMALANDVQANDPDAFIAKIANFE